MKTDAWFEFKNDAGSKAFFMMLMKDSTTCQLTRYHAATPQFVVQYSVPCSKYWVCTEYYLYLPVYELHARASGVPGTVHASHGEFRAACSLKMGYARSP